jgi:signal transduction histidine kinase
MLLAVSTVAAFAAPDGPAPPRLLVIFSCQPRQPSCLEAVQAIETTAASESNRRPELYFEFLDSARLGAPTADAFVRDLAEKYAGRPPNLVMASGDVAADLFLRNHLALWPNAPVVTFDAEVPRQHLSPGVIHLTARRQQYAPAETIEAALRMLPGTRSVYVVIGAGPGDASSAKLFYSLVDGRLPGVAITEIRGLSLSATLERVSHLPEDAILLTFGMSVDGDGRRFVPAAVVAEIAAASNRPVFTVATSMLGTGAVGGFLVDYGADGRAAARVALGILEGKPVPDRPDIDPILVPMFDWRQLRRWGIDSATLPPGSVVTFREPTFLERYWAWLLLAVLQSAMIAGLLVQGRLRARAATAAAASESLNRSIVASLSGFIAVVGRDSTVIHANAAWREHPPNGPLEPLAGTAPGDNLCDVWSAKGVGTPAAVALWEPIARVLSGTARESSAEFAHERASEVRWYRLLVQALDRAEGGVFIAAVDVTARKVAELDSRQALREISHAARVTTMGELAASLAHEINQPLAAILTNAQASTKLLSRPVPDVEDVKDALVDIARDARRAGDVIGRLRTMLKKGDAVREPVDLNALVTEVLALVGPEALHRRVTIEATLSDRLPSLRADAVQLQQVVVNLVVNALDALAAGGNVRRVRVITAPAGDGVELVVEDDGPGIPPDLLPRVFDPFVTTKASGLGMGLAIIRSIVEAHGGTISAENLERGGAVFRCCLPRSGEPALLPAPDSQL